MSTAAPRELAHKVSFLDSAPFLPARLASSLLLLKFPRFVFQLLAEARPPLRPAFL